MGRGGRKDNFQAFCKRAMTADADHACVSGQQSSMQILQLDCLAELSGPKLVESVPDFGGAEIIFLDLPKVCSISDNEGFNVLIAHNDREDDSNNTCHALLTKHFIHAHAWLNMQNKLFNIDNIGLGNWQIAEVLYNHV